MGGGRGRGRTDDGRTTDGRRKDKQIFLGKYCFRFDFINLNVFGRSLGTRKISKVHYEKFLIKALFPSYFKTGEKKIGHCITVLVVI